MIICKLVYKTVDNEIKEISLGLLEKIDSNALETLQIRAGVALKQKGDEGEYTSKVEKIVIECDEDELDVFSYV